MGSLRSSAGGSFAGLHMHGHISRCRLAAKDAVRRRNVGVVPAHRGANMPVMRDQVIGRVEAHPAQMRQQHIHPGMSGVGCRAVVIFAAAIEIAGDIARGIRTWRSSAIMVCAKSWQTPLPLTMASSIGESTRVERGS